MGDNTYRNTSPKGILLNGISEQAKALSETFLKVRNKSKTADGLIALTKQKIDMLKSTNKNSRFDSKTLKERKDYLKAVERIFKRLDELLI